jgi:hypothetical protein
MTSSLHVYEPGREYPLDAEQQLKLDEKKKSLRYENEKFLVKNKDLTSITRFLLASVLKSKPENPVEAIAHLVADDKFEELKRWKKSYNVKLGKKKRKLNGNRCGPDSSPTSHKCIEALDNNSESRQSRRKDRRI